MKKLTLNVDDLQVASFEIVDPEAERGTVAGNEAMITGRICVTRPTIYGTCCTP